MRSRLKFILRALRHRNYRIFFIGLSISFIGHWVQLLAVHWLVYRLTGSAWMLGLTGFCSQIPSFIVTPIAGVLVDRWDRRKILLITQAVFFLQAVILSVLYFTGTISVTHVLILATVSGVVNAIDVTTRQAIAVDLIDGTEDLGSAIALNSSMVHSARLIGPSVAGILIASFGEGICFVINAVSYIAIFIALFMIQLKPRKGPVRHPSIAAGLTDGVKYVLGHAPIRAMLILLAIVSFSGMPYMVLLPVFAKEIFHGGPQTLGFFVGASGIGALCGAIFLASRTSLKKFGRIITAASMLFGLGLIGFALSRTIWLSFAIMLLTGFGMMIQFNASNTFVQFLVEDDKRGRVMSFYTMAFMGTTPLGNLAAGILAEHFGAPLTLIVGGILCLIASVGFARRFRAIHAKGGKNQIYLFGPSVPGSPT